jgi:hypothetical protein
VCNIFAQSGERRNKGNLKEKERKDGKDTNKQTLSEKDLHSRQI